MGPSPEQIVERFINQVMGPLCEFPERMQVQTLNDERGILVTVYSDKADLGRLIGKKGSTVNAVRLLLRAFGTKNEARYSLKVDDLSKLNDNDANILSVE